MPPALFLAAALATAGAATTPVDAALLDGLPEAPARLSVHGETHDCTGPKLADVLARIGVPHGEALRGAALARAIVVHARDGYAVLFSLGELDPGTGGEPAIVATRCDGKPLGPDVGPYRLVLPNDARPARAVRQVETIELR